MEALFLYRSLYSKNPRRQHGLLRVSTPPQSPPQPTGHHRPEPVTAEPSAPEPTELRALDGADLIVFQMQLH